MRANVVLALTVIYTCIMFAHSIGLAIEAKGVDQVDDDVVCVCVNFVCSIVWLIADS